MTLVCVDHPFNHHGNHSGYKMLGKFLGAEILTYRPKAFRFLDCLPQRTFDGVLHLHPNWYSREALIVEWEISKRLLFESGTVYHFLYGENSFRRSGKVNYLTGHRNYLVATYHQIPAFFEQRRKQFSFLNDLDAVVLVSSNQRTFFDSMIDSTKIHVIPHGVDTQYFFPASNREHNQGKFRCVTVGSNYRDINLHIEVIKNINRSSLGSMAEFFIVGESRHANEYSGITNVQYFSSISDLELLRLYQSADILLMPLIATTANNAILESMACGLPIVVSDVEGIRDYLDETFAVIVPQSDPDAMTTEVIRLLSDPNLLTSMGFLARRKAEECFDWEKIATSMKYLFCGF